MRCLDSIVLNVPQKPLRSKEPYDFDTIQDLCKQSPKIRLNIIDYDDGPITKLSATLDLVDAEARAYIIILDDDIIYNARGMEKRIEMHPKSECVASALFGRNTSCGIIRSGKADILEAFSTIMCHRKLLPKDRAELLKFTNKHFDSDVLLTDDLVISAWFALNCIEKQVYNVPICDKNLAEDDILALSAENLRFRNRQNFDRYKTYFGKPMRSSLVLVFLVLCIAVLLTIK